MTTYSGKSCSFGLPRVPFVNCRRFIYLVISLLVGLGSLVLTVGFDADCQMGVQLGMPTSACDSFIVFFSGAHCPV